MHKYYARRPYNVFQNIIRTLTKENDIVMDCFCGGGVTIFESCRLSRKAIGVDLNPLATFITEMQMFNGDLDSVINVLNDFMQFSQKYLKYYEIKTDNDNGIIEWVEWAYTVQCPYCKTIITLSENNKIKNGFYKCPDPNCKGTKGVKRTSTIPIGSTPIRVKYVSSVDNKMRIITDENQINNSNTDNLIKTINIDFLKKPDFDIPMNWDRQYEDRLKDKGIIKYSDFFTERNFKINVLLFNDILSFKKKYSQQVVDYLYFLFSSSLRYTNNMTRVTDNWEGGNPTSMDKHAFWLPNQYVETNIIKVLQKRKTAIIKGLKYSYNNLPFNIQKTKSFKELKSNDGFLLRNTDASNIDLPDSSVDIVVTDPPYGSNVQYAELSTIWNAWFMLYNNLDHYIYKDKEAVSNRKKGYEGAKDEKDYENLLHSVFKECYRVLKDDGKMVFTFNNKNLKVWIAMLKAVAKAGFDLCNNGIHYQDFINSYKNTAHLRFSGNIHGDFIYIFEKKGNYLNSSYMKDSLTIILENNINTTIASIFTSKEMISTTDLYQEIFTSMIKTLMDYIVIHTEEESDIDLSELSDDYITKFLQLKLIYENGYWSIK